MRNVGRRKSVFAEAYNPEEDEDDKPSVSQFDTIKIPFPHFNCQNNKHLVINVVLLC